MRAVHDDYVGTWGVYGELFEHLADAHLPDEISAAQGRLHVAVTRFGLPRALGGRGLVRAELISEFRDKRDLVDALTASQYVPGLTCGPWLLRWFRGGLCCDGGLLDNTPLPPPSPEAGGGCSSRVPTRPRDDADDGADEADDDSSDGPRAAAPRRPEGAAAPRVRRARSPRRSGACGASSTRALRAARARRARAPLHVPRPVRARAPSPVPAARCPLGRVEERVVEEIRRGYRAAHAARRAQPAAEHAAERAAESKSTRRRASRAPPQGRAARRDDPWGGALRAGVRRLIVCGVLIVDKPNVQSPVSQSAEPPRVELQIAARYARLLVACAFGASRPSVGEAGGICRALSWPRCPPFFQSPCSLRPSAKVFVPWP